MIYPRDSLTFTRSTLPLSSLVKSLPYSELIPSFLHPTFCSSSSSSTHWVIIEAHKQKKCVGLACAQVYDALEIAQLYGLTVLPPYRQKGIGTALFFEMERVLVQEEKIRSLELTYSSLNENALVIEKILASQKWAPAYTSTIFCYFKVEDFRPIWFETPRKSAQPLQFFSWNEWSREDKQYVDYLIQQGRCLTYLSPFAKKPYPIHEHTSLGIRQGNKIVGWCLTTLRDAATVCYSVLYIDRALFSSSYGIALLKESIQRLKISQIPYALFEVNLKEIDASWWNFIKKRLMPFAYQIEKIKKASRIYTRSI